MQPMTRLAIATAAVALASPLWTANAADLASADEVRAATYDNMATNRTFDFTATVAYPPISNALAVTDDSGHTKVYLRGEALKSADVLNAGDKVHLMGGVFHNSRKGYNYAWSDRAEIVGHGQPPEPLSATPRDLASEGIKDCVVSLSGFIADVFRDEIDPWFTFFVLSDGVSSAFLALPGETTTTLPGHLIGATVKVVGIAHIPRMNDLNRKVQNVIVEINSLDSIKVIEKAPDDPFDVPALYNDGVGMQSYLDAGLRRRKITGKVLAVWRDKALLKTTDGLVSRIQFADAPYPKCDAAIDAAGIPDTDFFRLNLSRAIWRETELAEDTPEPQPEPIDAEALLTDGMGNTKISVAHYGKLVTVSGILAAKPSMRLKDMRGELACGDMRLTIDLTSAPDALEDIDLGSTVEVTGVCVIEAEVLRLQTPYPHIQDIFISVRTPADISVTKRPPWWTPGRLLAVVGALLAALVVVVVWNRTLNRLARRRGRQLMREQIEREKATLKTDERTRLAVELHDSVAQNLSGVSMQIDAALRNYKSDEKKMVGNLTLASTILKSSREELRNCLWDLRNHALDEDDMNAAIRQTLKPVVDDTQIAISFNVPRKKLSENTAHAVLRIIRELVSNSIRHGKATKIDIVGEELGNGLRFSVSDNGLGFEVASAPGPTQGHFGLIGIKERLRDFSGTMEMESTPGKGTRTVITIS